jgi:hypothetical protein
MLNLQMSCNVKKFRRLKMVGRRGSVIWFNKLNFLSSFIDVSSLQLMVMTWS